MPDITDEVLWRENGFVDRPADWSGYKNFGITMATSARWRRREMTSSN